MVSKVEITLFIIFIFTLWVASVNDIKGLKAHKVKKDTYQAKVALIDANLREVNSTNLVNEYKSKRVALIGDTWYFEEFFLKNQEIKELKSHFARKKKNIFILDGNISVIRRDNSYIRAKKVTYSSLSRILRTKGAFFGKKGESYVRGVNLFYDLNSKLLKAQRVFAHYKMEDRAF